MGQIRVHTAEVEPWDRGHAPGMLALGVGVGTGREGGEMAAQPGGGKLDQADLPCHLRLLCKQRILGAIGQCQQGKNVLRAVRPRGILAGSSLHGRGDDRAEVLLACRIFPGEPGSPDHPGLPGLRGHLPDVGILVRKVRIGPESICSPDLGCEVTAHGGHHLVIARAETGIEDPAGVDHPVAFLGCRIEIPFVAEIAVEAGPGDKACIAAMHPPVDAVAGHQGIEPLVHLGKPLRNAAKLEEALGPDEMIVLSSPGVGRKHGMTPLVECGRRR